MPFVVSRSSTLTQEMSQPGYYYHYYYCYCQYYYYYYYYY